MTDQTIDEEVLFHAARRLESPEERNAFIDRECAGDPDCAQRLRGLLAIHDRETGDDEETPSTGDASALELIGSTIGPYRLMEKIGEV